MIDNDPHSYCELTCVSDDSGPDENTPKGLFACRLEETELVRGCVLKLEIENLRRWRLFCDALSTESGGCPRFDTHALVWDGARLLHKGQPARDALPDSPAAVRSCIIDACVLLALIHAYWDSRLQLAQAFDKELAGEPIPS